MKLKELKLMLGTLDSSMSEYRRFVCGSDKFYCGCPANINDIPEISNALDSIDSLMGSNNRGKFSSCRTVFKVGNYIIKVAIQCHALEQNIKEIETIQSFNDLTINGIKVRVPNLVWTSQSKSIIIVDYIPDSRKPSLIDNDELFDVMKKLSFLGINDMSVDNFKIRSDTLWILDLGV